MSDSYQRGGQPRSVPDVDADDYKAMIQRHLALQATNDATDGAALAPGSHASYWDSHPGTVESLVPVWGSAREAIADYRNGDKVGAAVNGALAVADLTGEGFVGKELMEGGAKIAGSNAWKATRKWMGEEGLLDAGQHGHHWLIPRKSSAPDWLKNQPWNIKGMASPEIHGRVHGSYAGQPQFNLPQRLWYGTPAWAKTQAGLAAANAGAGIFNGLDDHDQADAP